MTYPIKISWKTEIIPIILVLLSIVFGIYFYQHFPAHVVTHWSFNNRPNGYMGRFAAALIGPIVISILYLVFLILPLLDPKRERYISFSTVYNIFRSALVAFYFLVFMLTGLYNLGYHINIGLTIVTLIGLLFVVLGNYLGKIRPNWFIGVRTPWTLSSENVWTKTHRFSGKLMVVVGLIFILIPWVDVRISKFMFLFAILLFLVGSVLYSYLEYRKEYPNGRSTNN